MTRPAKVVHLTSFHPPLDTRLFYREIRTVAAAGYEVVLIAPGERDEVVDGVPIRAIPRSRSRLGRLLTTIWQVYRAALREGARLYHFHDPELIPVGVLLKLCGKRVIYDVHEDVPRQLRTWYFIPAVLRGPLAALTEAVERLAARVFDGVAVATPVIAARFPGPKTVTVQNFPIADELAAPWALPYADRSAVLAYVGGTSEIRGIKVMVEAMGLLPEGLGARLKLGSAGFVPPELGDEVRRMPGWRRCELLGWQDRAGVARLLGEAKAGLVVLHPTRNHIDSYPVKLFEYMAAGIPVIASDFPIWRDVVEGAGCGLLVDPLDATAVARAIRRLLEDPAEAEAMGRRGRETVHTTYNWTAQGRKLVAFYARLLG
ncbi:MAG: glycosyltransferase family 4 protein [Phycisphaerae bacterium]